MTAVEEARFELGRTTVTPAFLSAVGEALEKEIFDDPAVEISPEARDLIATVWARTLLQKHARGDWGIVDPEDAKANEDSLKYGSRLLSVYEVFGVKVYVITDGKTEACPACWAGIGTCEPDKGSRSQGLHFRDDLPPRRLSTTVMLPSDY